MTAASSSAHVSSGTISTLFKSRNTLLSLLEKQGYNVADYADYSVNEIQTMFTNNQLDMLLSSEKDIRPPKKVYVKYYLNSKQIRPQVLDEVIEDLFLVENILSYCF